MTQTSVSSEPPASGPAGRLPAPAIAWGLWGLTVALLALGLYLFVASREVPFATDWGFRGYPGVLSLPFATVGAVVAARRPRNPIGWLMCAVGLISAVQMVVEEYAVFGRVQPWTVGSPQTAEWIGHWIWMPAIGLLTASVLLFPAGRLLSPRWKVVGWMAFAGTALGTLGFGLAPSDRIATSGTNPVAVQQFADVLAAAAYVGLGIMYTALILAAAAVVIRTRRSKGDERQQMKWLVLGAALLPLSNLFATLPISDPVRNVAVCGLGAFPVAMGISILKYRLYEIDRVINRTLVYGVITTILVGVYLGIVFVLQQALEGFTEGSSIAVAGSTLAVAALFSPLRAYVQRFIDARFYRRKYDAQRTLEAFAAHLRHEVDLDALSPQLLSAVHNTVEPAQASVWLLPPKVVDAAG